MVNINWESYKAKYRKVKFYRALCQAAFITALEKQVEAKSFPSGEFDILIQLIARRAQKFVEYNGGGARGSCFNETMLNNPNHQRHTLVKKLIAGAAAGNEVLVACEYVDDMASLAYAYMEPLGQ